MILRSDAYVGFCLRRAKICVVRRCCSFACARVAWTLRAVGIACERCGSSIGDACGRPGVSCQQSVFFCLDCGGQHTPNLFFCSQAKIEWSAHASQPHAFDATPPQAHAVRASMGGKPRPNADRRLPRTATRWLSLGKFTPQRIASSEKRVRASQDRMKR